MGHKNYSNFSKHFNNTNNVEVENNEIIDGQISIDEITNPDVKEDVIEQYTIGYVYDCEKLNVREQESLNANVLLTIDKDSKIKVDLNSVNTESEFYKVVTPSGVEGYCLKKYIIIPKTSVE